MFASPSFAEPPCYPDLKPVNSDVGYSLRPKGGSADPKLVRCEGLYASPIAAPGLQLVSLVRGKIRYDLQPQARLVVQAPSSPSIGGGQIHIRAMALPLKTYYRMDAILDGSRRMEWPMGDVVLRLGLHETGIGVFGWIRTDRSELYIPLRVSADGRSSPSEPIEIGVRTSTTLGQLKWRLTGESSSTTPDAWRTLKGDLPAGKTVSIMLPEGPAGVFILEVIGQLHGSSEWTQPLSLRLLRTPP